MGHEILQTDLALLRQGTLETFLKVELMDSNFKILDSLEGQIINDNYNQDNESIQRRTYNFDLVVLNSSFIIGKDKKIWLDKRLKVFYGLKSLRTNEIIWYELGVFCYVSMKYSFSNTEKKLSVSCADLMALYNGTLRGQIHGYGSSNNSPSYAIQNLTIPAGEDIRSSVIAILKDAGIDRYIVEDINKPIPYELTFETGSTYADIWTKIRDLYDSWEFYFDVDGAFIWRKIPTCLEDPVVLNDTIMQDIVVNESADTKFDGIYNVTEIWGKVLELESGDRYAETSLYTQNTYSVTFDMYTSWDSIDNLTQLAFKVSADNAFAPKFTINNYSPTIPIYDGDGKPLVAGALKKDNIYVFRYRRISPDHNALFLLGQFQCYGKYVEESADCPFSTTNLGYEISQSLDYSNLSDNAACYNQAEFLTYKSTAMMDTINLTTLVVPWLEVNTKIKYTPKYNNITSQYIVKNLSWSTGNGTMSVTLYKFLESFSYVYNRKNK
ncbi:DUF5048 domain-containing protein [Lacrimispora sp.]|uniref:DUF5048 domain-containing protein n=1 Tax=Lacrimispora sp. TaxID=2719234 RepID=UPI0028A9E9A0|nr:DUF5048 domain-containing protein [Lacrimispora sp.]